MLKSLISVALVALLGSLSVIGQESQDQYVIQPMDVLAITVWDQPEMNNAKFTVDPDGAVILPLLGRLTAAGLTVQGLTAEVKKQLAAGFLRNPQVTIRLEQFRQGRVFVFGAVSNPGPYQLIGKMTLIEVLARAGYGAASEAVVVRTKGATGPILPGENAASEVIEVNLRQFEKDVTTGQLQRNIALADGDTVFVPRTDSTRVFVQGQVKTPGAYSVPEGTTVLEVIQLAGGLTDNASTGRIQIIRIVKGKQKAMSAKLTDTVLPGDTVNVREKFF